MTGRRGGRTLGEKVLVAAAVEVRGEGSGRVRLRVVKDATAESALAFIRDNVVQGATIRTDGWTGHEHVAEAGYRHQRNVQAARRDPFTAPDRRAHVAVATARDLAAPPPTCQRGSERGSRHAP